MAILLELLGRLVGSTSIAIAAAAALGAVIGDAALTPRIDGISLTRHSPTRMTAGVSSPVRIVLAQPRRRHTEVPPVVLIDDHPSLTAIRILTPPLRRGKQVVINLRVTPAHRGYWEAAGDDTLEAHSPLGGFVRRRQFTLAAARWVHPAPANPIPLPDLALGSTTNVDASSRSGHGTEIYGIREWRSGDGASSVHWRASARRNQLVVMERERPASAALVVLLGSATEGSTWEQAISRAAATAVAARRLGQSVTLIDGGQESSPDSLGDVLDWFAVLGPTQTADPAVLLSALSRSGPGTTVLWLATTAMPPALEQVAKRKAARIVVVEKSLVRP